MLSLQALKIGDDCVEVSLQGEVTGDGVPRLEAAFAESLAEQRHLMLNFGACEYVSSDAIVAILAGRRLLARSGLDLTQFGASGIVRPILREAFARHEEEASASLGRMSRLRKLTLRPAA